MSTPIPAIDPNRPRVVISVTTNKPMAQALQRNFRAKKWVVYTAADGESARVLANKVNPDAAILSTKAGNQSGWLICDKMTRDLRNLRVTLIHDHVNESDEDFSLFVGATSLFSEEASPVQIVDDICGTQPIVVS